MPALIPSTASRDTAFAAWSRLLPWLLLIGELAWCAAIVFTRRFNSDEYEHLHASWYVLGGAVPFRDFFEHHHPLLWFLLAPVVAVAPESFDVLSYGRVAMWCCHVASAGLLISIGRRACGEVAGLWAAVLWTSMACVQNAAVEIRPDVPMTTCLLLAYRLAHASGVVAHAGAGASFGVAFLLLQKAVLFAPALALVALLAPAERARVVVRRVASMVLGACAPLAIGAAYLVLTDSFADWWTWSVRFNTTAPPIAGAWYEIGFRPLRLALLESNTLAIGAMAAGAALLALRAPWRTSVALVGGAALLIATLALTRRPYDQYTLPALTLPAVVGGAAVAALLERMRGERVRSIACALVVACIAIQNHPRPWGLERHYYKARELQRQRFELALARVAPGDVVFQGYPPFGIHRRDASYFWFLPFDLSVRAQRLGLAGEWSFRDTILERRPAVVSIGTARSYRSIDTRALHHQWLVEEAGYRWIPELELYERVGSVARAASR